VGPWSDLYALGATITKAITFETPPKANDRVFDDPWVPLAVRAELRAIYSAGFLASIDRAMAVRIENRWKDAGEWLGALRGDATAAVTPATARTHSTQPANDPPPASVHYVEKTGSRIPWAIAAFAAVVILSLVIWANISPSSSTSTGGPDTAVDWTLRPASEEISVVEPVVFSEKDKESVNLYRKMVDLGDVGGIFQLATCYERGIGVANDKNVAIELYRKGAAAGDENSIQALKRLGK